MAIGADSGCKSDQVLVMRGVTAHRRVVPENEVGSSDKRGA